METFRARGQKIAGTLDHLAQYCALEDFVISQYRKGQPPSAAHLRMLRGYASDFYDTLPARITSASSSQGLGDGAPVDAELAWAEAKVAENPFCVHGFHDGKRNQIAEILRKHGKLH